MITSQPIKSRADLMRRLRPGLQLRIAAAPKAGFYSKGKGMIGRVCTIERMQTADIVFTARPKEGHCEFCKQNDVPLVGVLAADPSQCVCGTCHADERIPTKPLNPQQTWQGIPPAAALKFNENGFEVYDYQRKNDRYVAVPNGELRIAYEFLENS
jgi:hypothetical protein